MSFESFQDRVKRRTRAEFLALTDPEADIPPKLWHSFDGSLRGFTPPAVGGDFTMVAVRAVQFACRAVQPDFIALQSTTWVSRVNSKGMTQRQRADARRNRLPEGFAQPSEDPDREEWVVIGCYSAETFQYWAAEITRTGSPPALGDWTVWEGAVGGRVHDVLRHALLR